MTDEIERSRQPEPLTLEQMIKEVGRIKGWAPGEYTCQCRACLRHYLGEKRSYHCLNCAVTLLTDESDLMARCLASED